MKMNYIFSDFRPFDSDDSLDILSRPASSLSRSLQLCVFIQRWAAKMNSVDSFDSDRIFSSDPSQCFMNACDLSALLDQLTDEGVDWSELDNIDCSEYSEWWQHTQGFLSLATDDWRDRLESRGLQDVSRLRVDRLRRQSELYESGRYASPVIAAGSTGSHRTTLRLLRSISGMANGALILPGLDIDLPEEQWTSLSSDSDTIFFSSSIWLASFTVGFGCPSRIGFVYYRRIASPLIA